MKQAWDRHLFLNIFFCTKLIKADVAGFLQNEWKKNQVVSQICRCIWTVVNYDKDDKSGFSISLMSIYIKFTGIFFTFFFITPPPPIWCPLNAHELGRRRGLGRRWGMCVHTDFPLGFSPLFSPFLHFYVVLSVKPGPCPGCLYGLSFIGFPLLRNVIR